VLGGGRFAGLFFVTDLRRLERWWASAGWVAGVARAAARRCAGFAGPLAVAAGSEARRAGILPALRVRGIPAAHPALRAGPFSRPDSDGSACGYRRRTSHARNPSHRGIRAGGRRSVKNLLCELW
jgi:hypothetical protein